MSKFKIGCIADDFTGASDAASFLAGGGINTLLIIWPHTESVSFEKYDAVVVALKSRSSDAANAVRDSLSAVRWLRANGAEKIYFKYCSTFDSTPHGNIGPVCDAILEELDQQYTLLCPSLLPNGRSVRDGILYVNGVPLAESHMSHHPLNPMWSSEIKTLMEAQSKYHCFTLPAGVLNDRETLSKTLKMLSDNRHFYLVPDYYEEHQGDDIVRAFRELAFMTGGSGLLENFARLTSTSEKTREETPAPRPVSGRVMLAGSCSDMTRRQVKRWIDAGGRAIMVSGEDALAGLTRAKELASIYISSPNEDILYYSSGSSDRVTEDTSDKTVSTAMEHILAAIARDIYANCAISRLISAGGETSGAITKALGFAAFFIGRSIAPGVPVLHPCSMPGMSLVLKSGNFGEENFFIEVLNDHG